MTSSAPLVAIVALKRSGHHAFIEWLAGARGSATLTLNNIRPSWPPKADGAALLGSGPAPDPGAARRQFERGDLGFVAPGFQAIVNYEGIGAAALDGQLARLRGQAQVAVWAFLRDPVNTFASIAKRLADGTRTNRLAALMQANAFIDIMARQDGDAPFDRVVRYAPWVREAAYRAELAEDLGIRDAPPQRTVPAFGGGSSFGGRGIDPIAERDALFARWQLMQDDAGFLGYFADAPTVAAMRRYFALFGRDEPVAATVIDELAGRAARQPAALAAARGIAALRARAGAVTAMETSRASLVRKARRMRLRLALG